MKYLLILTLLLTHLFADSQKQKVALGAGAYYQTQPYKGVDNILLPSPVVFFDNELFYMRWTRVGIYFLGESHGDSAWAFSLTAQPRVYGYKSSDILGMSERKNSFEGGLAFSLKNGDFHLEVMALRDIIYESKNWVSTAEIGYDFSLGKFDFYPSLIISYQSDQFTNYYYGVKQNETTLQRSYYTPLGGVQLGAQTYISYPINKQFSLFGNLKVDRLSHEASQSPLVKDKHIYSGLLSLLYHFEY